MSLDTLYMLHIPISVGSKKVSLEMVGMGYSNCLLRVEMMKMQDSFPSTFLLKFILTFSLN